MLSDQDGMLAVLQASAAGDVATQDDGHAFLVINPRYHDGERASFLMLPSAFYGELLRQISIDPQDVRADASGRLCAVTEKQIVLTVTTDEHMVHVLVEPEAWRSGGGGEMTIVKLFDEARKEGWAVSAAAHQALFDKLAKDHGLMSQWKYSVQTDRMLRSKGGVS